MSPSISLPREVAGVRIPDSALTQKAVDLVQRVSPAAIFTHSIRTYLFGSLVGAARGIKYDEELFFLGAVLHNLGLVPEFRAKERFEVAGADAADAFLKEQGVPEERRGVVWDAIALHSSVGIANRKRPEIALVYFGAGVDVLGVGLDAFPPLLVEQILDALPRHDFKKVFFDALVNTIAAAPEAATLTWLCEIGAEHVPGCPCPSFQGLLWNAPFSE